MSEPTPLSDQDKIRLKRLAKLEQQQNTTQPTASTSTGTPTASAPAPQPAPKASLPSPVPSTGSPAPKPKPTSTPPTTRTASASPAQPPAKKPAPAPAQNRFVETFEQWDHEATGRILGVTLEVDTAQRSNWSIVYLKDVASDLVEEEPTLPRPLRLSTSLSDRLLLSRLSLPSAETSTSEDPEVLTVLAALPPQQTAFEYLAGCWKRERAERSKVALRKDSNPEEAAKRFAALDHVKQLVVSYLGLVLIDPSMFPQDHITSKPLGPLALSPLLIPSLPIPPTLPLTIADAPSLLTDLSSRFIPSPSNDHESGMDVILSTLLSSWGSFLVLHKVDIGSTGGVSAPTAGDLSGASWRDVIQAVQNLAEIKPIAAFLPTLDGFDPTRSEEGERGVACPAEMIEYRALLGPITRLGAYPDGAPTLAQAYFPNPSDMGRGNIDSATASLRGVVQGVQTSLFRLHDALLRSSPSSRALVLAYFARIARLNAKRAAMRVDPRTVSSESFVGNLHAVLLGLSEPFMDARFTKIDKIDPTYYRNPGALIDVREETKINATQEESNAFFAAADSAAPAPNFISHTFFLCAQYLHLGPLHAIKEHKGYGDQIRHMERNLRDMEEEISRLPDGDAGRERGRGEVERYKKRLELYKSHLLAYEVALLDPAYLSKCAQFGNLVMAWLVRLVDPRGTHPHKRVELPLPEETPETFRMLPEFLIEDITEFLSFTSKFAPRVLEQSPQDELITFMLVFLSTPYMKNPYLKGQFVEIMYYLSRPTYSSPRGCLGDVLNFHQLALKNLMPCLVHAYIEIEITGSHTQFYDKFNIRYYITQLFKMVWENPTHRESLKRESQVNFERYVRFVNLLMNDTTYLLDDALIHLAKIAEIQREQDNTASWDTLTPQEKQEKEKLLKQYEQAVRSDLDLGTESLRLLKLFAKETTAPFLTPEIVDRLAAMLDMNLSVLAGPRCQDLKVKDPSKYRFSPRALLTDVLDIFLQLGRFDEFQAAVAKDGRSYSAELFARAARIARKTSIKTEDELKQLEGFVVKVEAAKAAEEEDEAMGDVPDEFLDPLTYDLMRDPVLLPSSKTVVDRSTIKQHYLSDPTDPFNRQPLKWEDITDAVDVKKQIEEWREERRRRKAERAVGDAQVHEAEAAAAGGAVSQEQEQEDDKMKVDE
ncbi:hypothetical protein JCM8097_001153 [Rhodosporidiobolus ruineniae]